MRCQDVRSQLLDVVDAGAMPPELAEHMESCASCREHLEMLRRHREQLAKVESPQAPDELWHRIERSVAGPRTIQLRPVWWTAAAAAVVLVAIGVSMVLQTEKAGTGGKTSETMVATGVDVESIDYLMAEHYGLRNANILNKALVSESEQNGYVMLAGGLP